MKLLVPFLLAFLFQTLAFAYPIKIPAMQSGNWVGNGGVIVTCRSTDANEPEELILLDLLEGSSGVPDTDIPDGGVLQKLNTMFDRIGRFDPKRAAFYKAMAADFGNQVEFSDELIGTFDAVAMRLPKHCKSQQAVVQYSMGDPFYTFYEIDADLWNRLSFDMKAALILHEILYFEADLMGHRNDSSQVRRYVRAVVGNHFVGMSREQYSAFMNSLHLGVERWQDPETKNIWTLSSIRNLRWDSSASACKHLAKGRTPTREEFVAAAPRLFASKEAGLLSLKNADTLFWVRDAAERDAPLLLNYEGREVAPDERFFKAGLCVGET